MSNDEDDSVDDTVKVDGSVGRNQLRIVIHNSLVIAVHMFMHTSRRFVSLDARLGYGHASPRASSATRAGDFF